jgi:predicted outer membrane repeat protein
MQQHRAPYEWTHRRRAAGPGVRRALGRLFLSAAIIGCLWAPLAPAALAQSRILYAKPTPTGTGDCLSWANACALYQALSISQSSDEIWAAAGVHKPLFSGTNRNTAFFLKTGVSVYGGFVGTETSRSQRNSNPAANNTVLSGDRLGNDALNLSTYSLDLYNHSSRQDNSFHVVYADNVYNVTLDGFTIRGGNANNTSSNPFYLGGGLFARFSTLTLTNLLLRDNSAYYGGALFLYRYYTTDSRLENVTISHNSAIYGGAIYTERSAPQVVSAVIAYNYAAGTGGALVHVATSGPRLTNVTLAANRSGGPCGIMETIQGGTTVVNSILWGNSSPGSLICNNGGSTTSISHSIVQGGYAGVNNLNLDPQFVDLDGVDNLGGTPDDNLRPLAGSPVLNSGNNSHLVPPSLNPPAATDLDGRPRILEATVDRGAYEYEAPTAITLASFTAAPAAGGVLVQWETAVEIDNAGFHLYRANSPDGEFVQINDQLIAATGNGTGAQYRFIDRVDAGSYVYQLEDIDAAGVATRHTLVASVENAALSTPQLDHTVFLPLVGYDAP